MGNPPSSDEVYRGIAIKHSSTRFCHSWIMNFKKRQNGKNTDRFTRVKWKKLC